MKEEEDEEEEEEIAAFSTGSRPKRRIVDIEPPGLGPWWAFMMINVGTGEGSKKQTEVRLDTNPDLIKAIKNATDQGDWVIVMKLGPFYELEFAGLVFAEWSDGTRGPGPRIAQGICLWDRYKDRGINLWVIGQSKVEVQTIFRRRREERHLLHVQDCQSIPGGGYVIDPGYITAREILMATGPYIRRTNKKAKKYIIK